MNEPNILARGNALLLAQMERLAKATEAALEKEPQSTYVIPFSSSMESLHREIRESVAAAGIVPPCAEKCEKCETLSDDDCRRLCDTLALWAHNANCNLAGQRLFYVGRLAGAQEVLSHSRITNFVRLASDGKSYAAVSVGGYEKKVDARRTDAPPTDARTEAALDNAKGGVTLTEEQCQKLCKLMAAWMDNVNRLGNSSPLYERLHGLLSALDCLGISHNLLSDEDTKKYSMARVGGVVIELDDSTASD